MRRGHDSLDSCGIHQRRVGPLRCAGTLLLLYLGGCSSAETGGADADLEGEARPEDVCATVTCSDHGTCKVVDGLATCECDPDYRPVGTTCVPDSADPCFGVHCSGHGTCKVVNDVATCECATGYQSFGTSCIPVAVSPCAGITCSGHGTCKVVNGAATCTCGSGYKAVGTTCVAATNSCTGVTCSGHGTCKVVGGIATCVCATGYKAVGTTCVAAANPCAGVTCSGHGTCKVVNGAATCICASGYKAVGKTCVPIPANPCTGVSCSGHGTCKVVGGAASCICGSGYFQVARVYCLAANTVVAAKDSSPANKARAKYICTGSGDQATINKAISATPSGGRTLMLPGTYYCSGDVLPKGGSATRKTVLQGSGEDATVLAFSSGNLRIKSNYVEVSDLRLTNRGGSTSGKGICKIEGAKHVVLNRLKSFRLDRWATASFWMTVPPGTVTEDIEINHCKSIESGGWGFLAMGWAAPPGKVKNIRLNYCQAIKNGSYFPPGSKTPVTYYGPASNLKSDSWVTGFDLCENGPAEDVTFVGCVADGSWESGFHQEPEKPSNAIARNFRYINCVAKNCGQKAWTGNPAHPGTLQLMSDPNMGYGYPKDLNTDFGAGFLVSPAATLKNCRTERNIVGIHASYAGAGDITGYIDVGSKIGILVHNTGQVVSLPPHFSIVGASLTDNKYPIQIWNWTSPALFQDVKIKSTKANANPGIQMRSSKGTGEKILIKNSTISNCAVGVKAYSGHPVRVDNVCVTGASQSFVNCKVVSPCKP